VFVVGASVIAVVEWLALSLEPVARAFSILGKRQISCPSSSRKLFFMYYGDVDTALVAPGAGTAECIGSLE
jgi:hypothetical protein